MLWHDLFHYETPAVGSGALPAPGTGEVVPGTPESASAATENTEAQGEPQGPIPYARFKEVNDARRSLEEAHQPFAELEAFGYGADDLQRLVSWEQEYTQDPVGVWLRQAEQIDALPDEVKAAIETASAAATSAQGPLADGSPPQGGEDLSADGEPPEWAKPLIQEQADRKAKEQETAISSFYDGIVKAWQDLDVKQGLVKDDGTSATPAGAMHAFIASASVNASSAEELLRTAREGFLSSREELLKVAVKVPGRHGETVPRPVPGGGGATVTPPTRPRTLREATRMAQVDADSGLLGARSQ